MRRRADPQRVFREGAGLIMTLLHLAIFTALTLALRLGSLVRSAKNRRLGVLQVLTLEAIRHVQSIASPRAIRLGLDLVTLIFNVWLWKGVFRLSHSRNLAIEYIPIGSKRTMKALFIFSEKNAHPISRCDGLILFFHGGGYFCGDMALYLPAHERLLKHIRDTSKKENTKRWCVVSADYKRFPEANAGEALDECFETLKWLIRVKGVEPSKIVVAGDSAGGCLALRTAMLAKNAKMRISRLLLVSPWITHDTTAISFKENKSTDFLTRDFVRKASAMSKGNDTELSPLDAPGDEIFSSLPPTLCVFSEAELFRDDCERLTRRLTSGGVTVRALRMRGMPHVWPLLWPWVIQGPADRALNAMASFCAGGSSL